MKKIFFQKLFPIRMVQCLLNLFDVIQKNRIMEEKNEISLVNKATPQHGDKVSQELKKLSEIQKSIADMQAHVKFLLKRQTEQQKKLVKIKDQSVQKAVSKLSFVSELAQSESEKKKKNQLLAIKNSQVKEFREKQLSLMKQTRLQISKLKEIQRTELREISKRNDQRVRKMKEQEKRMNFTKASNIKNKHASLIKQKQLQKELQKKRKEEEALKRSLIKLSEKEKMEIEIQRLKLQEEEITARLEKKKQIKLKFHETTRKISSMNPKQVIQKSKNIHQAKDEELEEIQKLLFKSAVRKIGSKQKQSILFCR